MDFSKNDAIGLLYSDKQELMDLIKLNDHNKTIITYSKNIFLPLTHICQNSCGYCTFKEDIASASYLIMDENEIFDIITNAKRFNCTEAMFAFGESADKNELVLNKLNSLGFESMVDYVYYLSEKILNEYGMLPHTNMGIISKEDLRKLSYVNASMGLMLETTNKKLMKTIVHKDSPTKDPQKRLKFISDAGKEKIPFTTGLLIGIGESIEDRVDSLFELRKIQDKYHNIQEIIIQNFKSKENIPMFNHPEPSIDEMLKLTMIASLMFPDLSIQIPPNLNPNLMNLFVEAGADDLGGISPITKDYINPDMDWPNIDILSSKLSKYGYNMVERLPVYDTFISKEFLKEEVYDKVINLRKTI